MGFGGSFILFVLSLFFFHFHSHASPNSNHDTKHSWQLLIDPTTATSRIWLPNNCNFDKSVCDTCQTGDRSCAGRPYVDRGRGSLLRWRAYDRDVAEFASNLFNNVGGRYSLVKLLFFIID